MNRFQAQIMYEILTKNLFKAKYFILFTFFIALFLLLAIAHKNDEFVGEKKTNISNQDSNIQILNPLMQYYLIFDIY